MLLFFLFMLFVISTNNPAKLNQGDVSQTLSGELLESWDQESGELDKLVEKMSEQEWWDKIKENDVEESTSSWKLLEDNSTNGESLEKVSLETADEEKKGLFSFLNFGKNKSEKDTEKWSSLSLEDSEKIEDTWSNIENIEDENPEASEDDISVDPEVRTLVPTDESTGSWETEVKNESLFDKLFGEREVEEEWSEEINIVEKWGNNEWEENSENWSWDDENSSNEKHEEKNKSITQAENHSNEVWSSKDVWAVSTIQNIWWNMMKGWTTTNNVLHNASYAYMNQYPKHIVEKADAAMYPGTDLISEVGKLFEVWVQMLKLNNANFNVKLGLMHKWDTLKQLTEETQHGCFMIEILNSKNKQNIGKKWYVCKKYLREATNLDVEYSEQGKQEVYNVQEHKNVPSQKTDNQWESFLPEDPIVESVSSESFLPVDPVVESFLPEEDMSNQLRNNSSNNLAIPQEASRSEESFLPEEPIILPSSESFLPAEPITESFLPAE